MSQLTVEAGVPVDVQCRGDPLAPGWDADSLVPDVSALFAPAAA